MSAPYEDNFGFWDIDGPDERAFFEHVRRQSLQTRCKRCDRIVRLMPPKTLCARCASAVECGAPVSMDQYDLSEPREGRPRRRAS